MADSSRSLLDQPSKRSLLETLVKDDGDEIARKSRKLKSATANVGIGAKPVTTAVPRSQYLDKAKGLLVALAEANRKLDLDVRNSSRADYDMEVLRGDEECIEMDLLLGITDLHTDEAVAAAEAAMGGFVPAVPTVSSSSSDTDDDSDEDGAENGGSTCRNKNPKIVMLDPRSN